MSTISVSTFLQKCQVTLNGRMTSFLNAKLLGTSQRSFKFSTSGGHCYRTII